MPYFAYGSNLNAADLAAWCQRQRLPYPLGTCLGRAWLPDHQLVFDTYSATRRGGVANMVPRKGVAVPGVLFKVRRNGWRVLNIKEGAPKFYQREEVTVLLENGQTTQPEACRTYMLPPSETYIPPTEKYFTAVAEGYTIHGLPKEQLAVAAENRDAPLPVFVYGTLKRGGRLHGYMRGFDFVGESTVPGKLLNCGWYPGLVEGDDGEVVHGELFRVRAGEDVEVLLRRLDTVEGFGGYGNARNLYERRILATCDVVGPSCSCWVYKWMGSRDMPKIGTGTFSC